MGGVSSNQTTFKVDKKRRQIPGTSVMGGQRGVVLDRAQKVGIHKWATQPHKSLVFALGKDNDLMAKKPHVPGTSIIKIDHKRVNYVNPKTESIKYPEMSGIRLFQGPSPIPVALAACDRQHKPSNEHILDLEVAQGASPLKTMGVKRAPREPELMNVRPYTNFAPGTSSKFSLQKSLGGDVALPGTSVIFREQAIPSEQKSYSGSETVGVRLNDQSSKDWQIFTVEST